MNKTEALKATTNLKFWNSTMFLNGVHIANVRWFENPWLIIPDNATFDQVSDREYTPIKEFHTRADLLNELFTK